MREFVMGARLALTDSFSGPIRSAAKASNQFTSSVRSSTEAANHLRESALGLKEALVALAGIEVGKKAHQWLVGANADMEQYQNTLTVVLGSQQKAIDTLTWATKFAAQTPFEIPQVVEATTRMSAYGIEAQKTLGIVGDMASVMGKDLMQAVEAVADAQTGELERLKEFGITKQMIQDQAKLLGSNPINNSGQITDTKAFNAALFALMEKRFKGGMDMQSKSFKGMLSNASDFMGTMGRELGKPLFDYEKKQLEKFLNTLNQLKENGSIDRFVAKVHKAGAVVANEFAFWSKVSKMAFKGIEKAAAPVFEFLNKNWESIKPFVQGVAIAFGALASVMGIMRTYAMAASIAMRLLSLAMLTNPVGWIILGIGILIGLFIKMNGGMDGAKAKLLEYWAVAQKFWQALGDLFTKSDPSKLMDFGFGDTFNKVIISMVAQVRWLADNIPIFLSWVMQKAQELVKWFVTNWPKIKEMVVNQFMVMWAIVGPVITQIISNIVNAFMMVYDWFIKYWPGIKRYFELFWAWTGPYIMAALQIVWSIIKNGFMLIWNIIQDVWNMITGLLQIAWGVISGIFGIGLALLMGDWQGAWDAMLGMLTNVWEGIKKFFYGLGSIFYDSGKALILTLADGIKAAIMAPINAVKGVMEKINEYLPHSDAKKGPLSTLTYSGGAIMTTMSTGVNKQAGSLQGAVSGAFSDTGLSISPNSVTATPPPVASASGGVTIGSLVDKIELTATPDTDADSLVDQLIDRLYARASEVTAILAPTDKGVLL